MTAQDQRARINTAQLFVQILIALLLAIMTGLGAWTLNKLTTVENRVSVNEARIEAFMGQGPRYTEDDAQRDNSVILRILEGQGKTLEDHEGRLRIIEQEGLR